MSSRCIKLLVTVTSQIEECNKALIACTDRFLDYRLHHTIKIEKGHSKQR